MEVYTALVSALLSAAMIFGYLSYAANRLLFDAAWTNKKYIRTIIIMFLHGPIVWVIMFFKTLKYLFLLFHILICWGLQEVPKDSE